MCVRREIREKTQETRRTDASIIIIIHIYMQERRKLGGDFKFVPWKFYVCIGRGFLYFNRS
jgi:hypothetical protein